MPAIKTPNLLYVVNSPDGRKLSFRDVEKAIHQAAGNAFELGKTTSVYVYTRESGPLALDLDREPVSVIYVKVTAIPW